jgi:GNAT superfamily N-acetyltransferase
MQRIARQHQEKGLSKAFVAVPEQAPAVICGYYALAVAELDYSQIPESHRSKLPRRIPGIRMGRLAVDRRYQGKVLGELLLVDALTRARRIQQDAGVVGLFVDAMDEQAAGFFLRLGFSPSPGNPLLLFLPVRGP